MKVKGIIDCDYTNYKLPCLTIEFPYCNFKCDELNKCKICQNGTLINEPDIEISNERIWQIYKENPLTQAFCFQGLEPLDSQDDIISLIYYIRNTQHCSDDIVIYTGYDKDECGLKLLDFLKDMRNIIVKWGRFIMGQEPHYDDVLKVKLASDNQYGEKIV